MNEKYFIVPILYCVKFCGAWKYESSLPKTQKRIKKDYRQKMSHNVAAYGSALDLK